MAITLLLALFYLDSPAAAATISNASPLLFSALAFSIPKSSGFFNIGAEGQMLIGGLAAALTGIYLPSLPAPILILACFVAAIVAGATAALIAWALKQAMAVDEVISTLLLTFVLQAYTSLVVFRFFPQAGNGQSPYIATNAGLPVLWTNPSAGGGQIGVFSLVALGFLIVYYWHTRSQLHLVMAAIGTRPAVVKLGGYSLRSLSLVSVLIGGGLAGVGSGYSVLWERHAFVNNFTSGIGYSGILVALFLGDSALSIGVSALLFGWLQFMAVELQAKYQWPKEVAVVAQVLLIFIVLYFRRRSRD